MAGRVLIFENDSEFAEGLRAGFEGLGLKVLVSDDGAAGIAYANETVPDLVLASAELQGMNGFLICKKFKKNEQLKHIPFVILSREAEPDIFEQHKKLSTRAQDYVKKPVGVQELLDRLSRFMPAPAWEEAGAEQDVEIREWSMDVHERPTPIGEPPESERPAAAAMAETAAGEEVEEAEPAVEAAAVEPEPALEAAVPGAEPSVEVEVAAPEPAGEAAAEREQETPVVEEELGIEPRPLFAQELEPLPAEAQADMPDLAESPTAAPARRAPISAYPEVPRLYIGCTLEGRSVAESIQLGLYPDIEADIRGAYDSGRSRGGLAAVADAMAGFQAAVLVVTERDLDQKRVKGRNAPRDDLVFTLGFLLGILGRDRIFLVTMQELGSRLPPDLAGIEATTLAVPESGDLLAATDALCMHIKQVLYGAKL
jgi:DNA-binding response OmpR family regulator/predicted nucleotide-binding protein